MGKAGRTGLLYACSAFFCFVLIKYVERSYSLVKADKVTDYSMVLKCVYIESLNSVVRFDYLQRLRLFY